ncbi:MAG: hypothetical protein ACRDUW_02065 [Pseudonocardiaceae bacterium]
MASPQQRSDGGKIVLSDRQERIASRLTLVGPGPARFFRDACELMGEDLPRATVTHLVSHLLREVESALRAVVEPPQAAAMPGHSAKIAAVLDRLEIDPTGPVAVFWLSLVGENSPLNLARRTHRDGLDAPRTMDNEFRSFVARFESLLDRVLTEFEARYVGVVHEVDELLRVASPTVKDAQRVRQKIPSDFVMRDRFFGKAGPQWLGPLVEAGFFSTPPEPEIHADQGTMTLPFWPESGFLVRVAPERPANAVAAALRIPHTANPRVNYDIVSVAIAVPVEHSLRLVRRIIDDVRDGSGVLIPQVVGGLATHLATGGHPAEALDLLQALLEKAPAAGGSAGWVDTYTYAEILRSHVPTLVAPMGLVLLVLLRDLLGQAIAADEEATPHGRWTTWSIVRRPSLDTESIYGDFDPIDALVTAVRDTAIALVDSGAAKVDEVVRVLEATQETILQRLALHVLTRCGQDATDLVTSQLLDPALLRSSATKAEYLGLARQHGGLLSQPDLLSLFTLIDEGPNLDDRIATHIQSRGEAPPDATVRRWRGRWQRDHLAALRVVLPPRWADKYETLVAQFGEASEQAPVTRGVVGGFAVTAPTTAGDLAAMTTDELVRYLRGWQPPPNAPWGWTHESLGSPLTTAIEQHAARRSRDAVAFVGLPAHYLNPILRGMEAAARQGGDLDWPAVIRLCTWVNDQAATELDQPTIGFRQWREARLALLVLIRLGLAAPEGIAWSERDKVWTIIARALEDPDPMLGDETRLMGGGTSLEMLSMNVVRPEAIRVAVDWGVWARRHDPTVDVSDLFAVLEGHLDLWTEPSQAVRWVYGECFAILVGLDRDWAATHARSVFPLEPRLRDSWAAAWDAYLTRGMLHRDVWTVLDEQYRVAVDRIDPHAAERKSLFRAFRVGQHLVHRFCVGDIDLNNAHSLLRRFYDRAPVSARAQLIDVIGHSLAHTPRPAVEQLKALWELRLHAVQDGADPAELGGFGWWFASGVFDDGWALRQLRSVLVHTGLRGTDKPALTHLASITANHPTASLAVLEQWARQDLKPWVVNHNADSIRRILLDGQTNGDEADRARVRTIVSLLVRLGLILSDLLEPEDPPS